MQITFAQTPLIKHNGDLISIFKPLNTLLCSYNSKLKVPLNPPPRTGEEVSYALLEVIVETGRIYPRWKLKLGDVSITREFKPIYEVPIPSQNKWLYKFVYDVTDVLRTGITQYREGVNLSVKYEGGEPFKVLGLTLDSIYSDADASIKYKHYTGLTYIDSGKALEVNLDETFEASSTMRVIVYATSSTRISIQSDEEALIYDVPAFALNEIATGISKPTRNIKISLDRSERSIPIVISSITVYKSDVKAPQLDLCYVNKVVKTNEVKLELEICNLGLSKPDKLIISLIRRGELLRSLHEEGRNLEPGTRIRREISLPLNTVHPGKEITIRLVWAKLSRLWVLDRNITVL